MKMKLLTCVWILALLVSYAYCQAAGNTDQQRTEATENARQTTAALYDLIRGIAFPQSPTLDTQATNQNNRFILLMPGKVLNYFDYYPGREYTKFIQVQLIACKPAWLWLLYSRKLVKFVAYSYSESYDLRTVYA